MKVSWEKLATVDWEDVKLCFACVSVRVYGQYVCVCVCVRLL